MHNQLCLNLGAIFIVAVTLLPVVVVVVVPIVVVAAAVYAPIASCFSLSLTWLAPYRAGKRRQVKLKLKVHFINLQVAFSATTTTKFAFKSRGKMSRKNDNNNNNKVATTTTRRGTRTSNNNIAASSPGTLTCL